MRLSVAAKPLVSSAAADSALRARPCERLRRGDVLEPQVRIGRRVVRVGGVRIEGGHEQQGGGDAQAHRDMLSEAPARAAAR
jgi:hypothetical protein